MSEVKTTAVVIIESNNSFSVCFGAGCLAGGPVVTPGYSLQSECVYLCQRASQGSAIRVRLLGSVLERSLLVCAVHVPVAVFELAGGN